MDEEQFILRLPPPLAEKMQLALGSKAKEKAAKRGEAVPAFSIRWLSDRDAVFTADEVEYPATLMDLPNVCETHKTADKRTFFKSADVHQVLVVRTPEAAAPTQYLLSDGLTPAAKGAGTRLAHMEPIFSPEQVSNVENQLKIVLDKKIAFVQKEETAPEPAEELEIVEMEHESVPADVTKKESAAQKKEARKEPMAVDTPSSTSAVPTAAAPSAQKPAAKRQATGRGRDDAPPAEAPPVPTTTPSEQEAKDVEMTPRSPERTATPQRDAADPVQSVPPPTTAPPAAKASEKKSAHAPPPLAPPPSSGSATQAARPPAGGDTPSAVNPVVARAGTGAHDEEDSMEEAQRRLELIRLEKLVKEQEKVFRDLQEQAEHQSNPVMRRRLETKVVEAKTLLKERQEALDGVKKRTS